MSFSLKTFLGHAGQVAEHDFLQEITTLENWSEREKEVVADLVEHLAGIGQKLGGHIAISAYGHLNPTPSPGDNLVVNVNAVPDPAAPSMVPPTVPGAVPVETPSPVVPGSTPLESAQPGGSPAPVADAGLTQPVLPVELDPVAASEPPAVTSSGPDLGPAATEVPSVFVHPPPVGAPPAVPEASVDPWSTPTVAPVIEQPTDPVPVAPPVVDPAVTTVDPSLVPGSTPLPVDPTPVPAVPAWADPAAPVTPSQ